MMVIIAVIWNYPNLNIGGHGRWIRRTWGVDIIIRKVITKFVCNSAVIFRAVMVMLTNFALAIIVITEVTMDE